MKPLAIHKPTMAISTARKIFGEPLGKRGRPPSPPLGGRGDWGRFEPPNSEESLRLKSRQTSSRSGGPACVPGVWSDGCLGSSFLSPLRPQPGSLRLKILDMNRIIFRYVTCFNNSRAQLI